MVCVFVDPINIIIASFRKRGSFFFTTCSTTVALCACVSNYE